jgi:phosphonopyruvate decarboxylase
VAIPSAAGTLATAPLRADAFVQQLEAAGFDVFTGVPCSLIEDVIAVLERHPRLPYLAAPREDLAVGLAGGAWLAGRRPVVLMQNSGLGTSLNALASFTTMYGLPVLLLVTWRGWQGKDAPEHILTGAITPSLLELLGIPFRVLSGDTPGDDVAWAKSEMDRRSGPVALVVRPGVFATSGAVPTTFAAPESSRLPAPPPARELVPTLSRFEALEVAIKELADDAVVHANGYLCRESFAVADRPQNFYMIGSMGLAASIGLGLALARPTRRTVVFDGDGNLLMALGVLPLVAAAAPANFVHVVFDNEVYGSTGNQASPSRAVRLDRLAWAAGYRTVQAVTQAAELGGAVRAARTSAGPHFVLAKVTTAEADVPRIPYPPHEIRDRFRAGVSRS